MRVLIVDDVFSCRKLLVKILSDYGECDVAVNGKEAVEAFTEALDLNTPYHLICLDIMMPEMDGQEVLKKIRQIEQARNIHRREGVKIIMTTALDDAENILSAFRDQCESYIVKPIEKDKLIKNLIDLELINP